MKRIPLIFLFVSMLSPASALQVVLTEFVQPSCGHSNGVVGIGVFGQYPFYYLWNTGSTAQDVEGVGPGYYEVRVIDAVHDTIIQGWTLVDSDSLLAAPSDQAGHTSCIGSLGGEVQVIEAGINGIAPYSYVPAPSSFDADGDPVFSFPDALPGTDLQIQVTDVTGCTGILTERILAPQSDSDPDMHVTSVAGSCSQNPASGSVTITNIHDGGFLDGPYVQILDELENWYYQAYDPGNTVEVDYLPPGDYHCVRDWDPFDENMVLPCDGNPYDRVDFTIPDLGPDCGSVSGTVFIDNDQDCIQSFSEVGVPYQVLVVEPGAQLAITDAYGTYSLDLAGGDYTLSQTDTALVQLCPANAPVPFTVASGQNVVNLADSSTIPLDLRAQLYAGSMHPGFSGSFWGYVNNPSPQVSGTVTITLELDADLVFTSASPVPDAVVGNTITWELLPIAPLQGQSIHVLVSVPVGTPLDTPLSSTLSVSNALPEEDLTNNDATVEALVTGSFDPNQKVARTSTGTSNTQFLIGQDDWIDHTIYFQNTGTAAAVNVVITDTLSDAYDMSTFQQGVASHSFSVAFRPGRVIVWTFANIQLPDSGSNEALSHGLVAFRIRPTLPLSPGTLISNTANIFFDFNEPVITVPCVLIAAFSSGVPALDTEAPLLVFPDPVEDALRIELPSDALILRIRASDGRMVSGLPARAAQAPLQVGYLPPGAYSMEVVLKGGRTLRSRFIKQ